MNSLDGVRASFLGRNFQMIETNTNQVKRLKTSQVVDEAFACGNLDTSDEREVVKD